MHLKFINLFIYLFRDLVVFVLVSSVTLSLTFAEPEEPSSSLDNVARLLFHYRTNSLVFLQTQYRCIRGARSREDYFYCCRSSDSSHENLLMVDLQATNKSLDYTLARLDTCAAVWCVVVCCHCHCCCVDDTVTLILSLRWCAAASSAAPCLWPMVPSCAAAPTFSTTCCLCVVTAVYTSVSVIPALSFRAGSSPGARCNP